MLKILLNFTTDIVSQINVTRNKLNKFNYLLHVNVSLNQKTVTLCISALSFVKSQELKRVLMTQSQSVKTGNLMGVYCYIHDGFYSIFSESLKCFLFFNHEVDSIVHSTITPPKCISIADSLLRAFVFTSFDFFFFFK